MMNDKKKKKEEKEEEKKKEREKEEKNVITIKIPFKICNKEIINDNSIFEDKIQEQIESSENSILYKNNKEDLIKQLSIKDNIYSEIGREKKQHNSSKINSFIENKIIKKENNEPYIIGVVDDSDMARKMLIQLVNISSKLLNKKTEIYQANDGLDAILKFYNNVSNISIIFLDNIMPTLTGPITAKLLRALGYKNLIIGITGNSMQDDIEQFYDAGIDYLFVKPFSKLQLDSLWKLIDNSGIRSISNQKLIFENDTLVWKTL